MNGSPPARQERATLRHPVHFVVRGQPLWPEIVSGALTDLTEARIAEINVTAYDCWVQLTYVYFRMAGLDVTISDYPRDDAINVTTIISENVIYRAPAPFYVACRADGPDSVVANVVLDQNDLRRETPSRNWVPIWPQPSILPRDPRRGDAIAVAAFKGFAASIDRSIVDDETVRSLRALGVAFRVDDFDAQGRCLWNDYSDVDLVVAIRNLTRYSIANKPASKLVNAWMAEAPALLGPEPAYRALRRSEDDYIEVRSGRDIVEAVARLKENPDIYRRMIENGRRRRGEFSKERVLERWIALLNGPIARAAERWRDMSGFEKNLRRRIGFVGERVVRQHHRYAIQRGPKLLDP